QRTIAGIVQLVLSRVGRKKSGDKPRDLLREVAHNRVEAFAVMTGSVVTLHQVRGRPVGNVLVEARARLLLRKQEIDVCFREIEGCRAGKKHLALLQLLTVPAALLRSIGR